MDQPWPLAASSRRWRRACLNPPLATGVSAAKSCAAPLTTTASPGRKPLGAKQAPWDRPGRPTTRPGARSWPDVRRRTRRRRSWPAVRSRAGRARGSSRRWRRRRVPRGRGAPRVPTPSAIAWRARLTSARAGRWTAAAGSPTPGAGPRDSPGAGDAGPRPSSIRGRYTGARVDRPLAESIRHQGRDPSGGEGRRPRRPARRASGQRLAAAAPHSSPSRRRSSASLAASARAWAGPAASGHLPWTPSGRPALSVRVRRRLGRPARPASHPRGRPVGDGRRSRGGQRHGVDGRRAKPFEPSWSGWRRPGGGPSRSPSRFFSASSFASAASTFSATARAAQRRRGQRRGPASRANAQASETSWGYLTVAGSGAVCRHGGPSAGSEESAQARPPRSGGPGRGRAVRRASSQVSVRRPPRPACAAQVRPPRVQPRPGAPTAARPASSSGRAPAAAGSSPGRPRDSALGSALGAASAAAAVVVSTAAQRIGPGFSFPASAPPPSARPFRPGRWRVRFQVIGRQHPAPG